jgi:hypothetical protein
MSLLIQLLKNSTIVLHHPGFFREDWGYWIRWINTSKGMQSSNKFSAAWAWWCWKDTDCIEVHRIIISVWTIH